MITVIAKIFSDTFLHAAPILFAVLGGIYAYKANVLNVSLEGMILIGCFVTCFVMMNTGNFLLAVFSAILATSIVALIFCFFGITLKGNVIIVGLSINMLATALTAFFLKLLGKSELIATNYILNEMRINIPILKDIPFIGKVFSGHTFLTYFSYIMIFLMWLLMYKTKFGVHARVVGENEDAAIAIGLKVNKLKFIAVIIGAVCCALAGASLAMDGAGGIFTPDMSAARGFIAMAAMYCGDGSPKKSSLYAILFGLARSISQNLSIYLSSASRIFNMAPYIIIVVVLLVVSINTYKNNKTRGFYG